MSLSDKSKIKKFLDENNTMKDAKGYHKGLYTAMNADAIAQHFYEQGRVDALKDSVSKAKNVDMSPRQSFGEESKSGFKYKVLGDGSKDFKLKLKAGNIAHAEVRSTSDLNFHSGFRDREIFGSNSMAIRAPVSAFANSNTNSKVRAPNLGEHTRSIKTEFSKD